MGRGGYLGGHTILVRGQFGPEGPTIIKDKRSKPFSDDYDVGAKENPKAPPPMVIRKEKTQKPARSPKPKPIKLDKFGLPVGLVSEGVPDANVRRQYLDSSPDRSYFFRVKSIVLGEARKGARVLSDFLIILNDQKIRTLTGGTWKREFVSGIIYDIRMEKYLPTPTPPKSATVTRKAPHITKRVDRMQRPERLEKAKPLQHKSDETKVAKLAELDLRISELEKAWDGAIGQAQRQKYHDQLSSAKKRRKKIYEGM